jgi:SPFH domain / Band 7 family
MLGAMPYRDDREALRQRNRELEQELARAREELDRRDQPVAIEPAPPVAVPARRAGAPSFVIVLTVVAVAVALALGSAGVATGPLWIWIVAPVLAATLILRAVVIAGPHEAVVLGGIARKRRDGSLAGYRIVHAARVFSLGGSLVDRLDLGIQSIRFTLGEVITSDAVELELELGACARIDVESPNFERAVERFAGSPDSAVRETTREIVATSTRGVLASHRAEEVFARPRRLAEAIRAEAEHDFAARGMAPFVVEILAVRGGGKR